MIMNEWLIIIYTSEHKVPVNKTAKKQCQNAYAFTSLKHRGQNVITSAHATFVHYLISSTGKPAKFKRLPLVFGLYSPTAIHNNMQELVIKNAMFRQILTVMEQGCHSAKQFTCSNATYATVNTNYTHTNRNIGNYLTLRIAQRYDRCIALKNIKHNAQHMIFAKIRQNERTFRSLKTTLNSWM
jgi:hypothetical protein